jgi:hypothetical protein
MKPDIYIYIYIYIYMISTNGLPPVVVVSKLVKK